MSLEGDIFLRDLNRFLDENNIIKRDEVLDENISNDFDVRTAQFLDDPIPESVPEPPPPPPQKEKPKRKPRQVTKEKPKIKTRKEMIEEMIEKTSYQLLSKEVDYEVYQIFEQKHCQTSKDRDICNQNMKGIRKDAKMLERKLEVLHEFLKKEVEKEKNG